MASEEYTEQECERVMAALESAREEYCGFLAGNQECSSDIYEAEEEIAYANTNQDSASESLNDSRRERNDLLGEREYRVSLIEEIRADLSFTRAQLETAREELERGYQELYHRADMVDTAAGEIQVCIAERELIKEGLNSLPEPDGSDSEEYTFLLERLEEADRVIAALQGEYDELDASMMEAQDDIDRMQNEVYELQEGAESNQSILEDVESALSEIDSQIEGINSEISEAESELETAIEEMEVASDKYDEAMGRCDDVEMGFSEFRDSIDTLESISSEHCPDF